MKPAEQTRIREAFDRQAEALSGEALARESVRARRLVHFAEVPQAARVLDVGCGAGPALAHLMRQGARPVGVDISRSMLELARTARVDGLQAVAEGLPFRDQSFDLVLCRETLHHVTAPDAAVWEMRRVLARGGALVVEDVITHVSPEIARRHNDLERLHDPAHERLLSVSSLTGLVEEAGFEIDAVEVVEHERELEEWVSTGPASSEVRSRLRRALELDLGKDQLGLHTRRADGRIYFDVRHAMVKGVKR
ncbi:MAG: class I SAM-dependent methyltransferase [Thermoplasmatota archaeon]